MKIKQMLVLEYGWVYSSHGEIEPYAVNGEVIWYRQTGINGEVKTFNGKYVVMIEHFVENFDGSIGRNLQS